MKARGLWRVTQPRGGGARLMSAFDRAEVAGITQAIGIDYWPA